MSDPNETGHRSAPELEREARGLLAAAEDLTYRFHGRAMPPEQRRARKRYIRRAEALRERAQALRQGPDS